MNNNIKSILGMVAVEPRQCDTCPCEKTNCKKIDADGIGQFCLVSKENVDKLKDNRPVTERIKTFEDAREALGDEHPLVKEYWGVVNVDLDITQDLIAYLKLRIIVAALIEGWEPKFEKGEYRYYPWFYLYTKEQYDELDDEEKGRCVLRSGSSTNAYNGFVNVNASYDASSSGTYVGSRLAFRTRELAAYAGRQFTEEWADFMFKPRTDEGLNGKSEAGTINFNGHE